jgi:prepilin-type N-terminal cleavage/methylation domain-containing protein
MKRRDAGFSLMEVMVGSALMSVVMAIATAAFVHMYRTTSLTEANALTEANLMASFAKLDRDVRYAYRINAPYQPDASTFAVDYVVPDANSTLLCVQLTLPVSGGALIRKQWPQTSTSADAAAVTSGVATNVVTANSITNAGGTAVPASPFTVRTTGQDGSNFDRLRINVNSTAGNSDKGATRNYNLQFTALNTEDLTSDLSCTKA